VHGAIGALLDLGAGFHPELTGRENALLASILNGLTRRQALARLDSIVPRARSSAAWLMSWRSTENPRCANTCAMPLPIVPLPITPTR